MFCLSFICKGNREKGGKGEKKEKGREDFLFLPFAVQSITHICLEGSAERSYL